MQEHTYLTRLRQWYQNRVNSKLFPPLRARIIVNRTFYVLSILSTNSGKLEDLGREIIAGPDLQLRAIGRIATGIIQTDARLGIEQGAIGLRDPLLTTDTIAIPDLKLATRRRPISNDIQALAQGLHRSIGHDRPDLCIGAIAVVKLYWCPISGVGCLHIHAFAAWRAYCADEWLTRKLEDLRPENYYRSRSATACHWPYCHWDHPDRCPIGD